MRISTFQCSSASRKFLNARVSVGRRDDKPCFSALQRAENSSMLYVAASMHEAVQFQCSSASRKFLNGARGWYGRSCFMFQCSSASRKFLNSVPRPICLFDVQSFSALQRAENSSIGTHGFERWRESWSFSALQRAENSSIACVRAGGCGVEEFQCSSASRKFLNRSQCRRSHYASRVSVLFSEPKIPQWWQELRRRRHGQGSVLFSEPKIPQSTADVSGIVRRSRFSALQRAENSSMTPGVYDSFPVDQFQCSSASRKFLN